MKITSTFLLLALTTQLFAKTNAGIYIRGRMPASTTVEWNQLNPEKDPIVKFKGFKISPDSKIIRSGDQKKLIITSP